MDALGRLVFSMLRLLSAVRFASKLVKPKHHCYASCHVALCISFTTKIPVDQSCLFWLPCERGLPVSIGPAGRPFSISARGALFQFPIGPQDFDKAKSEDHRKGQLPGFEKMDGLAKAYQGASERSSVCCMISVTCICHFQRRILDVSEQAHCSKCKCSSLEFSIVLACPMPILFTASMLS